MSLKENDVWLEDKFEKFKNSTDGRERSYLLWQLKQNGFEDALNNLVEDWYQDRRAYMHENDVAEADMLADDEGKEYFMVEKTSWAEVDGKDIDYADGYRRVYMPDHLNVDYWKDYGLNYPWEKATKRPFND